jgi:hypothetical protein
MDIHWHDSLAAAGSTAREEGKLVLTYFWAPG